MKITMIFLLTGVLQVSATVYSQNTKISFDLKDISVKEVLNEIERTTEFRFFYNENFTDLDRTVTIEANENRVEEILNDLLASSEVTFKVLENNLIVITPKILMQQIRVTGMVTDASNGEPLPGVTVQVQGTMTGAISQADGSYSVNVSEGSNTLVFSFVGYTTQEIAIGGRSVINVAMVEEITALEEVVVVGYGTQTKRSVTGAIQTINSEELADIPVTSATQTLQGKVAGVQINQTTGRPGEGMAVRIRGAGSISAGSEPLYVIDGFPITGDLTNFNTDEIESITILKDAASTSLYGSRAANGVVLVTTKKGTQGRTEVGFNAYYGVQVLPEKGRPDMMNGTEFAQYKKESYEDKGQAVPAAFQNPEQYGEGYDWYDIMFRKAPIQEYTLSLTTRTDRFSASAIAGFTEQDGIAINSGYNRYSLRLNTEYKVSDMITFGFNVAPTYNSRYSAGTEGAFHGGNLLYLGLLTWPIMDRDGNIGNTGLTIDDIPALGGFPQANYYESAQEIKSTNNSSRLLSNAYLSIEPIDGLVLKQAINIEYGNGESKLFNPSTASSRFAVAPPVTAFANYGSSSSVSWLSETTATYTKALGSHNLEVLAGYSVQEYTGKSMDIGVNTFPDDRISDVDAATVIDEGGTNSSVNEWALLSYIGRLNYDFRGKYLISAAFRRDGSSRFGENNRWGNFPSVSVGWIVSEENFFPQNDVLSFLKVRASYGLTGNNNIGNYTQYASVNLGANYILGSTIASGSYVSNLANPTLSWEKSKQLDIGVDLGFVNNRISVNYDFYQKNTYDMLYNFDIPNSSGFGSFQGNSGELKFWGHEIAVTSRNFVGEFKWTTNANITFSDNEVVYLAPNVDAIYGRGHISKVGGRLGLFWGLIQDGIYETQEEYDSSPKASRSRVGTIKFVDVNGDDRIDNRDVDGDRTVIGDPTPKFLFGLTNTFNYRNFDLSIVASGSVGNDIANRFYQGTTNMDGPFNVLADIKYRWRSEENPGKGLWGTTTQQTSMQRDWFHSYFIKDGSFLTIKNVTLGYNVNVNRINMLSRLRIYASVQQLYTFTKYEGNNPEVSGSQNVLSLGDDSSGYPVPRTLTFGINVGF